jgi:hypothetical protein
MADYDWNASEQNDPSSTEFTGSGLSGAQVNTNTDVDNGSNFSWDEAGKVGAAVLGGVGRGLQGNQQGVSYDQGAQQVNAPGIDRDFSYMRSTALSLGIGTKALRKREERLQKSIDGYNEELQTMYDRQKDLDDNYSEEFFNQQKDMIKLSDKSLDFNKRIDAAKRAISKQRQNLSGIAGITKKIKDAGLREDSFDDFKISRWRA